MIFGNQKREKRERKKKFVPTNATTKSSSTRTNLTLAELKRKFDAIF